MAVYTGQLMGNHTRPASREARCRVAVERSQAARLPIPLRAKGAQSGVKGYYPLREARDPSPSGGNSAAKPLSNEYPTRGGVPQTMGRRLVPAN